MTKIVATTPVTSVTESSKYAYPPGISGDIHDQTFHCENPDQPGFVNNQIAEERVIKAYLKYHGWAQGLTQTFLRNASKAPVRYVITDCSEAMDKRQARYVVKSKGGWKTIPTNNWAELGDTLQFHAGLAHIANAATQFRLGHGDNETHEPMLIGGLGSPDRAGELALRCRKGPKRSDVSKEVKDIISEIALNASQVRALGYKIVIVIFTDVIPTDPDFKSVITKINTLPVTLVIRLCTDEHDVIDYWESLVTHLTGRVDVLNSFILEAKAIKNTRQNRWLTYGLPLHRMREFGITVNDWEWNLDTELNPHQLTKFFAYLFGTTPALLPDPVKRWKDFMFAISLLNHREELVWGPITSRMVMWVEMSFLKSVHPANELTGGTDCCACGGGGPATAELTGKKSNMSNVKDVKDAKSGGAAAAVAAAHAKNERAKGPPPGSTPVPVVANKCCVPKGKNDKCFAEGSDAECCPRAIESKECCLEGDSCYSTPDPNAGTGEKGCCMGGQNQKDGACCVAPPPKKMAPKVVKTGAEEAEEDDDADDDATDSGLATAGKGDESRPPAGSGETAFDPKGDEMSTSAAHRVAGDVDSTEHPVAAVATVQTLPHATAAPQGLPSSLGVSSGSLNTSGTAHAPGSVTGRGPGGLTSDLSEISLTNGDVAPHTEASAAAAAGVTGAAAAPVTKPKKPTCSIQ